MATSVAVPGTDLGKMFSAVLRELRQRTPGEKAVCLRGGAVVVGLARTTAGGAVVAAAVDDDYNPRRIIPYAAAEARRLAVPLRVVHVWTGLDLAAGARLSQHSRMSDADHLLSAIVYDHLAAVEADAVEREIVHDSDPVRALTDLSPSVLLMVLAARSNPATTDDPLGATVRALIGRTACPLAIVLPAVGAGRFAASA